MQASLLALMLVLIPLVPTRAPALLAEARTEAGGSGPLSSLAVRLQGEHSAVTRDPSGHAAAVFGVPAEEARILLLAVDRQRALPEGYRPPDLVWVGGRMVRAIARPDLLAMIESASSEGVDLAPISAYRGPDEQALAFESAIWGAMARANGEIDRSEAEHRTARFVAPPGHSQHQLGTAIDFSTWEINYAVQPRFAETEAGRWLEQHAWQFGFVLSYTRLGEGRSGYAYEPWHYRWIGRELAAVLHHDGYLEHPTLVVDDYLRAVEEIVTVEGLP
jgi:D-alanyl-D-alanine carboxypeptidase